MATKITGTGSPEQIYKSFARTVIEQFQILAEQTICTYGTYLVLSKDSTIRQSDEVDAVDQRFTRSVLEWLGFKPVDWTYNQPQAGTGKKANRPDYTVSCSTGIAFIVEDKNSSIDFDDHEHLKQMQRYCLGTAGYAVWCNMRRLLAIRCIPHAPRAYKTLVDVSVEGLFGPQQLLPDEMNIQKSHLALFHLLFSKYRFTHFPTLAANIALDEQECASTARSLETQEALHHFIDGSRQTLSHLKLAALSHIQEARTRHAETLEQEKLLKLEWDEAVRELKQKVQYDLLKSAGFEEIARVTSRLGNMTSHEMYQMGNTLKKVINDITGRSTLPTLLPLLKTWLQRALQINSALLAQKCAAAKSSRIVEAYNVWSEKQSDQKDVTPEVFAEQVAYVFFVRLLLVRVLEDKHMIRPRLASNGGFSEWIRYIPRHFQELDGVGSALLSRKARTSYLHFFQQAVFDWFQPDDFFLGETLEFLCRYHFQHITSDIIGFTYEAYIDRNARDRKGHFLTRHEVVEYMLDLAGYSGPQIIGRRILDPACGSGSFLVHAARRYRQALVTFLCKSRNIPENEEALNRDPELRKACAEHYIQALTTLFFGMEFNPFACYLAEMNLFIQAVDDLSFLQQTGDIQPIERFHIYTTDSLDLPGEIIDTPGIGETRGIPTIDHLSNRLTDEAYPIKARLDSYHEGFFYIFSNPPYVSSKQEEIDTKRFRAARFYQPVLSGDINLYLLFLRLGLYYVAEYGTMTYIVPLTIFGDKSARAARKLLHTPPFQLVAAVRFYRGDILFPGVDQAVAILVVNRRQSDTSLSLSGGHTVQEARSTSFVISAQQVTSAVPHDPLWQGSWLVAPSQGSFEVWQHIMSIGSASASTLGQLLDQTFERKQGDINATHLNPFRLGASQGSFADGAVAIYKGENILPFAPLPTTPSDWARPLASDRRDGQRVAHVLQQLTRLPQRECGIVMREVARLNTRKRLIATWFERTADTPIAFTHETWRMKLKEGASQESGKALLAIISSTVIAFLINLFSTNNHIGKDDLGRIPVPAKALPVERVTPLAQRILEERARVEQNVHMYRVRFPGSEEGTVSLSPVALHAAISIPTISVAALIARGDIRNTGSATGRIQTLTAKHAIICTMDATNPQTRAFTEILSLFFADPEREDTTWDQAQHWLLPKPIAATHWLEAYHIVRQEIQSNWQRYLSLQQEIDEAIADWYDLEPVHRATIRQGLPWAQRESAHRLAVPPAVIQMDRRTHTKKP